MIDAYIWAREMAKRQRITLPSSAHVLLIMADDCNMDYAYTGSMEQLSMATGRHLVDIENALSGLEKDGLIKRGDYVDPSGRKGIELLLPTAVARG